MTDGVGNVKLRRYFHDRGVDEQCYNAGMNAYQTYILAPVGVAVRHLREARGLSQSELATLVYGQPYRQRIHALESGRYSRCQRSTVERLATALGTTPEQLVELAVSLGTKAAV